MDRDSVPLVRIDPQYPPQAQQRRLEGWVHVRFTISGAGTVKNVKVVKSSDLVFENAAIRAVEQWKYQPQMEGGKPVERERRGDRALRPRRASPWSALAGAATCFRARAAILALLVVLLLAHALPVGAQGAYDPPAGGAAGAAAQPAEEAAGSRRARRRGASASSTRSANASPAISPRR